MRARAALLALLVTGCAGQTRVVHDWDQPTTAFIDTWHDRGARLSQAAILAQLEYTTETESKGFTLELFYRQPRAYLLRGRGHFGVEGFRALLTGDSITVVLDRQKRGYAGPADLLPQAGAPEMWEILQAALPWILGTMSLSETGGPTRREQFAASTDRPEWMEVQDGDHHLQLRFSRYRSEFPFWHLRTVTGVSGSAEVSMEVRQQLFNPELDSSLFELTLPPGTGPLTD